ncbi:MAG: BTAD domain-containing putative transcriptional regulator [Atopobiaceae bacterium]
MDVSGELESFASKLDAIGASVFSYNLAINSHSDSCAEVQRVARVVRKHVEEREGASNSSVVLLQGVPPADESAVTREARALRSLLSIGCFVVIELRPECMQLAEEFPESHCYRSVNLLSKEPGVEMAFARQRKLQAVGVSGTQDMQHTGGIPALVNAVCDEVGTFGTTSSEALYHSLRFSSAMSSMVSTSLRNDLMERERELRFALFLLGSGTFQDLSRVVSPKAMECIEGMDIDAPQFGVDFSDRTFCCAGISNDYVFDTCFHELSSFESEFGLVVRMVAEVLFEQGRAARAARIMSMIQDEAIIGCLICEHVDQLFDAGEFSMLSEVLRIVSSGDGGFGASGEGLGMAEFTNGLGRDVFSEAKNVGVVADEWPGGEQRIGKMPGDTSELRKMLRKKYPAELQEMLLLLESIDGEVGRSKRNRGAEDAAAPGEPDLLSTDACTLKTDRKQSTSWTLGLLAGRMRDVLEGVNLHATITEDLRRHDPRPLEGFSGMLRGGELIKWENLAEATRRAILGEYSDSFQLLLHLRASDTETQTVFGSTLELVYFCVAALVGGSDSHDRASLMEARTFFERCGLDLGRMCCDAAPEFVSLLMGYELSCDRVSVLARHCERRGIRTLHALCLMAQSIADQRAGVAMRACVRANFADAELLSIGADAQAARARIIRRAIGCGLGERLRDWVASEEAQSLPDVGPVVDVLSQLWPSPGADKKDSHVAAGSGKPDRAPRRRVRLAPPTDLMSVVNVLARDCGDLSLRFEHAMPASWKKALSQMTWKGDPVGDDEDTLDEISNALGELARRDLSDVGAQPRGVSIEVMMLGGLSVRVNGQEVDCRGMERRRAKSLLMLLCAQPGHCVRRYAAIESVWPEMTYDAGTQRVYEATSVLRNKLVPKGQEKRKTSRPVLANRAERTLSLNQDIVSVDVDRFEELAHRALDSEGNDRLVVSLCRKAESFYRGDLAVPATDGLGLVTSRRDQLRSTFVDCMVAGSTAALRLGRRLSAVKFARRASSLDDAREDAMTCLMRALVATGRTAEAQREYRGFVVRSVRCSHRPPSREIRLLARELFGTGAIGGGSRIETDEMGEGDNAPDDHRLRAPKEGSANG